jgi:hypothetical protein
MNRRKRHGNYHRLNTHVNNRPVCNHRRHQKTINHQNIVESLEGVGKCSKGSATYSGMRHQFGAYYKKKTVSAYCLQNQDAFV